MPAQSSEPGTQDSNRATETLGVGGALHVYVAVYFFFKVLLKQFEA